MRAANLKSWIRSGIVVFLALSGMQTSAQIDCLGVDGGTALPGTPCDDGQSFTSVDEWSDLCICVGHCADWDMNFGLPGDACNDGNPNTIGDMLSPTCYCQGYCYFGIPGSPCDDGDPLTSDDVYDAGGCYCWGVGNLISGQVFLDMDLDGVFSGSDVPIANRTVQASPSPILTSTDQSGNFSFLVSPGYYTLLATSGSFDVPAQVNPVLDLTVPGTSSTGSALAMNVTATEADLSAFLSNRFPTPGFTRIVTAICKNEGTLTTDGTLTITFDPQQTLTYHFPLGAPSGNTVTWNLPALQPGELFTAHAWVYTPPNVPLGTVFQYSAFVQSTVADALPSNDLYIVNPVVVNSYDPNDIQVNPSLLTMGDIAAGTPVVYTINFQNTGTAPAENVRITDLLPMQLRPSFFEFIGSSHSCHAQLSNGLLEFRFDQIMLPDSNTNEPESHGWVMFRMKPQNFLLPGASVGNSASIYFDFNEPIYTNSAVFEIELNTSLQRVAQDELKLWPNPATDLLNLSMDRASRTSSVTIIDMNGRVVRNMANVAVQDKTLTIPVADLADGLYTLRVGDGLKARNQRFVKSH